MILDASWGIPYGFRVILYKMVAGWYTGHVTGYWMTEVSHAVHYKEAIGSLFPYLQTHIDLI